MNTMKDLPASSIKETLLEIGAINEHDIELFSECTRDRPNLNVYRDKSSGVIFIHNFYVGEEEYSSGNYKFSPKPNVSDRSDFELINDTRRRSTKYEQFYVGKKIIDFGCGTGAFIQKVSKLTSSTVGVELDSDYRSELISHGLVCRKSLEDCGSEFDTAFLFHVLEHLPDPITSLKKLHGVLKENGVGKIVIEVPHANDFLLGQMDISAFKKFTLWSQHLVLHTRSSLRSLLKAAGFKNVLIEGCQRYSISNHLEWLAHGKPGGHKKVLSLMETPELVDSYANALSRIDANDTIVAVAST